MSKMGIKTSSLAVLGWVTHFRFSVLLKAEARRLNTIFLRFLSSRYDFDFTNLI